MAGGRFPGRRLQGGFDGSSSGGSIATPRGMGADQVVKHVLVVDDYPDMAELVTLLLTEASLMRITTEIGFDGAQAVAMATAHPPDVAILDIDMPVMNGIDAARAIRAALPNATLLLVAMTGNPGHIAALQTRQPLFDRVLPKPVDVEQLLDLLNGP